MPAESTLWSQVYDPLGGPFSVLAAAAPIVMLLGSLALLGIKAHWAALLGLATALIVAIGVFGMPADKALATAAYGGAFGLLPIGWIIINVIYLYVLASERGLFDVLHHSLAGLTSDRRLQLLFVAFCFGAFFEGAAGFGTPVAVTAAILIGLGFSPLQASGLTLIANTAPVAFGALGTPIIVLHGVTGLDLHQLSAMVGRQLPFFSMLVPCWLVCTYAGWRGTLAVWPALLTAGVAFAVPQFLVSNFHGPWLVDVVAAVVSMVAMVVLLRLWQPAPEAGAETPASPAAARKYTRVQIVQAWLPWIVLSVFVFVWGLPRVKVFLDGIHTIKVPVPGVHALIQRVPPVVAQPVTEHAEFSLNWLSATGTGILLAAIIAGLLIGYRPRQLFRLYGVTIVRVRYSLLTVVAMLALGFVTRYSGLDAAMGLAFAQTGCMYPFFGTLLGWLGVALTGSDTSSNVLFGSLQTISATAVGVSPLLMAAANSAGGVMGKMIDAQSIVVASTATRWYGHEGRILRFVFWHSLVLASLVGLLVLAQAYLYPFTLMVTPAAIP